MSAVVNIYNFVFARSELCSGVLRINNECCFLVLYRELLKHVGLQSIASTVEGLDFLLPTVVCGGVTATCAVLLTVVATARR